MLSFQVLFISLFVSSSHADTIIPEGDVSGSWRLADSPFLIQGEITIPYGQTLTIEPGVLIEFQGYYKLDVQGRLLAIGTEIDTIVFTIKDSTGFRDVESTSGGWRGISFFYTSSANDSSKIIYCKMEYGKSVGPEWQDYSGGAIRVFEFDKLIISHCLFENNMAWGGPDGGLGGGIRIDNCSNFVLFNCTFRKNTAQIGGGIMVWGNSNLSIINCKIMNNHSPDVLDSGIGGGICCFDDQDLLIKNTIISGNTATFGGGIYLYQASPLLINNLIIYNQAAAGGGIIFNGNSYASVINNTICDNTVSDGGGGIICHENSHPGLINTIIYGNTAGWDNSIHIWDDFSEPFFYYCDVQGGIGTFPGLYNIDADPLFETTGDNAYYLSYTSPSNRAGIDTFAINGNWYYAPTTDLEGNTRPNPPGSNPDIGAYENGIEHPGVHILITIDTLNFGQVYLGYTNSLELVVSNTGSEDLLISNITTNLTAFTVSPTFMNINPGKSEIFTVRFLPQSVGSYPGMLTFSSNDPDSSTYTVALTGQGIEPPIISVSKYSIYADLFTGGKTTQTLTIFNTGTTDLIWQINLENIGSGIVTFTKQDFADWTDPANQDHITDNVWITRDDNSGLFNAATETYYDWDSPHDTEWSYGLTKDLNPEDYQIWRDVVYPPPSMVGQPLSLHLISDDKYFDMIFHSWTSGGNGGGFSYTRTDVLPRWMEVSEYSGVVPAGSSVDIEVTIDAAGLFGGDYSADIIIFSNDPSNQTVTISSHLHVTGAPDISISQDTLDFGQVFINYADTLELLVKNVGTADLLITSVTANPPEYRITPAFAALKPDEIEPFTISFTPTAAADYTGSLVFASNDPDSANYIIFLTGQGVNPPVISVTPDSLTEDLLTNEVNSQTVTIQNNGGSDLIFKINALAIPPQEKLQTRPLSTNTISLNQLLESWSQITGIYQSSQPVYRKKTFTEKIDNNILDPSWLLLHTDPDEPGYTYNIEHIYGRFSIDEILIKLTSFNLWSDMEYGNYGIIIYIDADQDTSTGAKMDDSVSDWQIGIDYAIIIIPGYLDDGLYYYEEEYDELVKISDLTTNVAEANSNEIILGVPGEYFKQYFAMNIGVLSIIHGDLDYIPDQDFENITFPLAPPWIRFNITEGVIPAGGDKEVTVTFDAKDLFGGDYRANINIISNDPVTSQIILPSHLIVTGRPVISMEADTVDFGTSYSGYIDSTHVKIENIGTDILEITNIACGDTNLTFEPLSLSILPLSSDSLNLYLLTKNTGVYNSTLTFSTNDPDSADISLTVISTVLIAPDISVIPDLLTKELESGQSSSHTLTIKNTGYSDLNFDISVNYLAGGNGQNYALQFDGVDDIVRIYEHEIFDLTTNMTIEAWIKAFTTEGPRVIVAKWNDDGPDFSYIFKIWNSSDKLSIELSENNNFGDLCFLEGSTSVLINKWIHVATTYNSNEVKLYYNGIEDKSINASGNIRNSIADLIIGANSYGDYLIENFYGLIDEVRIWNLARTQSEIQADMHREISGDETGLIGYWPFNEGSGNTTFDHTIYNNSGILQNGTQWKESTAPILTRWLTLSPVSGIITSGDSSQIDININAERMAGGDYEANILIASNDPDENEIEVPVYLHVITSIGMKDQTDDMIPNVYALYQNYPNPFNPSTTIVFTLPRPEYTTLKIYNILGAEVAALVSDKLQAGLHKYTFDGSRLASGVYYYKIRSGEFRDVKKMILLR